MLHDVTKDDAAHKQGAEEKKRFSEMINSETCSTAETKQDD